MSVSGMSPSSGGLLQSPAMASNSPSPAGFDFTADQLTRGTNTSSLWANSLAAMGSSIANPFANQPASQGFPMPEGLFPQFSMFNAPPQIPLGPPRLTFSNEGMPSKIRVETQIRLKMTLSPMPMGITKLHLPHHAISKPKLWIKPPHERAPDTLELYTMLVCTSAMTNKEARERALKKAREGPNAGTLAKRPESESEEDKPQNGGEVWICSNCMEREKKRSQRKRNKKPDEDKMWERDEWRRVVIFNTQEVREFPKPDPNSGLVTLELPMRLACYCRHQQEKSGYQVIFTLRDFQDRVVAQELTPSIMISDDHKTHPARPAQGGPASAAAASSSHTSQTTTRDATPVPTSAPTAAASNSLGPPGPFRNSHSVSDLTKLQNQAQAHAHPPRISTSGASRAAMGRTLSRPASPTNSSAPLAKKRKSSSGKIPVSMAMTPLDTSSSSSPPGHLSQSAATSPFTQSAVTFVSQDGPFSGRSPGTVPFNFGTAPTTPSIEDQAFFPSHGHRGSLDNAFTIPQQFSVNSSAHASRAPSPSAFGTALNAAMPPQLAHMLQGGPTNGLGTMSGFGGSMLGNPPQLPTISKVNPASGSKGGGYEVTILGSGFNRALEIMFGDRKATTTCFWAENILICIVPPSPVPGEVTLSFYQVQQGVHSMLQPIKFTYINDDEDKIVRTAMEVLARKMKGNLVDVKEFAMNILSNQYPGGSGAQGNGAAGPPSGAGFKPAAYDIETQLMHCLELVDLDDSAYKPQWDYRASSGHTMLHLACSLGYHRLAAGLLARGANYDVRDNGGYTPMHMAALNNRPEIVRRLLLYGADPSIKTLSGLTAADVATSIGIVKELRRVTRHRRTQSAKSVPVTALHSAASSTTSLKSLWVPDAAALEQANQALEDDESLDYSPSDSEESDDGGPILHMRRPSMHRQTTSDHAALDAELPGLPASPSAAAAVTRSFHQFQQAMAVYLQGLPQFPQMPAFTGMPTLAEMRRLASLVPGMSEPRPGSSDSESERSMGSWRQNLWPSWVNDNSAPPPAYEDIFPDADADLDRKPRSAAEALARQAADFKTMSALELPSPGEHGVLKIGRKNAITKEQQDIVLKAHEAKFKRLSRDRNLFFIWVRCPPPIPST